MKKQLKDDLVALAEKITLLKQQENVSTGELKELSRRLYEKLTVVHFTESNLFSSEELRQQEVVKTAVEVEAPKEKPQAPEQKAEAPAEELKKTEVPAPKKETPAEDPKKAEDPAEDDEYLPSGLEFNDSDAITEPNTEKIKDIVAQMPAEAREVDDLFAHVEPRQNQKNDMEDIGGVHYDNLPQFEPIGGDQSQPGKPKSLNDRLKKGLNIGVNDRHAFVRHLFEGSNSDYNRVLSQLNTLKSKEEAFNFVANMVKPDYNNWEGKEDYESRFFAAIEKKFE